MTALEETITHTNGTILKICLKKRKEEKIHHSRIKVMRNATIDAKSVPHTVLRQQYTELK